nr:at-rich interactive domain-containing protein 1 [Quercus suber]
MAGWSMLADGSTLDCVKTPKKKLKQNDFWVDLKSGSNGSDIQLDFDKFRCKFEGFLLHFGKEICGRECFQPIPPMLGDGQHVDLLRLLFALRENERWLKRVFDDKEHLMEIQDEIKDFLAKVLDQKKKRKDKDYPNLELEFKEVKSCAQATLNIRC